MRKLQTLLRDIPFELLPPTWNSFDLARFSAQKRLWDYQQDALKNALKTLWHYYTDLPQSADISFLWPEFQLQPAAGFGNEGLPRSQAMFNWYTHNDIHLEPINLGRKRNLINLLSPHYPIENNQIRYEHFCNRMGFWMATGSGKTVVIVKLIELLWALRRQGEIPNHDILVLTHREDLLQQLRQHVNEYNAGNGPVFIRLRELKEFAEIKRGFPSLLGHQEITIFFYRSDNLSDEQKERIIDFRNYENRGRWYVLLDEAHKGDKQDSKRQHIYSILSRNGFLFNFSATFTDSRDILTTAHEFNLSSFIEAGYGKHIALLKQENRAFRPDEDFTGEEKQKIVLQSLLMLTAIHKARAQVQDKAQYDVPLYHRPLLLALVNSVNTEDADLKLFFAQLERIARGELSEDAFIRAKMALLQEIGEQPEYLYEQNRFKPDISLFQTLTVAEVLRYVFNADSHGAIEVLTRPSNEKELAFKLKSAAAPFALIRIGNTAEWLKKVLVGYEIVKGFSDESFFERINQDDSAITLLMGSRSFYEGWDSNRPNVITFINIGVGADAKKFILQAVGRGVRLEPLPGQRRRLASLTNAKVFDSAVFQNIHKLIPPVETLFIFGTNRTTLETVFQGLDQEKELPEGVQLALELNPAAAEHSPLLIPTYRTASEPLIHHRTPRKFELSREDQHQLSEYLGHLYDDRLLLAHHNLSPHQIGLVRQTVKEPARYFSEERGRKFGNVNILLPRLTRYLDILPAELDGFQPLTDEISHYQHIRVLLQDIDELRRKIKAVQEYQDPEAQKKMLKEQLRLGLLDIDAYTVAIENMALTAPETTFTPPGGGASLTIKQLAGHYYLPLLFSANEKIDYIQHVIHHQSEAKFINALAEYVQRPQNLFNTFDWWVFSRTDETLDRVVIPYYDPAQNRMREFHPDFIFWLKRFNDYFILFVDPKGAKHTDFMFKVEGYEALFLDPSTHQPRIFNYQGLNVRVHLAMYTKDSGVIPPALQNYWYDTLESIINRLFAPDDRNSDLSSPAT